VPTTLSQDNQTGRKRLRCVAHDVGLDAIRVALAGEFDVATAPQADRALRATQAEARLVILDLRGVQQIGRTAARVALMADARARRAGGRLVVVASRAPAPRHLALTRLRHRLEIVEQFPSARLQGAA
jgi:anti-anti-sigma factor